MIEVRPVCEICGRPATHATRDVREAPVSALDMFVTWETVGPVHSRCDEHGRESLVTVSSGETYIDGTLQRVLYD